MDNSLSLMTYCSADFSLLIDRGGSLASTLRLDIGEVLKAPRHRRSAAFCTRSKVSRYESRADPYTKGIGKKHVGRARELTGDEGKREGVATYIAIYQHAKFGDHSQTQERCDKPRQKKVHFQIFNAGIQCIF
jgi:hypothetical protein